MHEPEHSRITRTVGDRIRKVRLELGISQTDLSEMAEIHLSSLGRIERGTSNPKLDMLARIAFALDTSVADLVSEIDPADIDPKRRRITASYLLRARREAEEEARSEHDRFAHGEK